MLQPQPGHLEELLREETKKQKTQKPLGVRLEWELDDLQEAVEGLRRLADTLQGDSEGETSRTAGSIGAMLGLVGARIRELRRVVQGQTDPASLLSPSNTTTPPKDQDVFLPIQATWPRAQVTEPQLTELRTLWHQLRRWIAAAAADYEGSSDAWAVRLANRIDELLGENPTGDQDGE